MRACDGELLTFADCFPFPFAGKKKTNEGKDLCAFAGGYGIEKLLICNQKKTQTLHLQAIEFFFIYFCCNYSPKYQPLLHIRQQETCQSAISKKG